MVIDPPQLFACIDFMSSIASLLNPVNIDKNVSPGATHFPSRENVKPQLDFLSALNTRCEVLPLVSPAVKDALDFAVSYFSKADRETLIPPSSSPGPFLPISLSNHLADVTLPTSTSPDVMVNITSKLIARLPYKAFTFTLRMP